MLNAYRRVQADMFVVKSCCGRQPDGRLDIEGKPSCERVVTLDFPAFAIENNLVIHGGAASEDIPC
jgi:hypothetical protein